MLADTAENEERPNIEEMYTSATHASNLKVEERRRGPADILIAAGWSRSRIGAALLRLHSEHDGAEKPQKLTAQALEQLADTFHTEPSGLVKWKERRPDGTEQAMEIKPSAAARKLADGWHVHELMLLFQKLKSLPDVRAQLILWCGRVGMSGGQHKVAAVLSWWLDPTCGGCDGQKWLLVPGTRRQSNKVCPDCHGSGEAHLPHGQDGRKMLHYINECLQAARSSMKGRFQHQKGQP